MKQKDELFLSTLMYPRIYIKNEKKLFQIFHFKIAGVAFF